MDAWQIKVCLCNIDDSRKQRNRSFLPSHLQPLGQFGSVILLNQLQYKLSLSTHSREEKIIISVCIEGKNDSMIKAHKNMYISRVEKRDKVCLFCDYLHFNEIVVRFFISLSLSLQCINVFTYIFLYIYVFIGFILLENHLIFIARSEYQMKKTASNSTCIRNRHILYKMHALNHSSCFIHASWIRNIKNDGLY